MTVEKMDWDKNSCAHHRKIEVRVIPRALPPRRLPVIDVSFEVRGLPGRLLIVKKRATVYAKHI